MKRALLAVVLLLIGTISYSMDISAGPKGALGYSTFLGSDWVDYMAGWDRAFFVGLGAGGFVTLGFTELFAMELEAMWWRLGGADKESGIGKESFVSNYISPAVLLKARLKGLSLFAGPMLLIKIGTGKLVYNPESGSSVTFDFNDDDLSAVLLAATAGFGYQFPVGSGHLCAELRGIYSFTRWFNQDLWSDNWQPLAVLVTIGYSFPLRGGRSAARR